MTENVLIELAKTLEAQNIEIEALRESVQSRALELENVGWKLISGYDQDDEGIDFETLKELSEKLREMAATNPLHVRGAQLRHAYIFGRGMSFQNVTQPRVKKALDDPHNKAVLFSVAAYETNNLALFTDGNLIVLRNEKTNRFTSVPIGQITAVRLDPDDNSVIQYIRRQWSSNGNDKVLWYPLSRFKKSDGIQKTITLRGGKTEPVSQDTVAYHKPSKRFTGWTWGIPDSLAAMIWSVAYSGYLQDNSKLVHALSKFAWAITSKSTAGADKVAAKVETPGVGGSAILGEGNALGSVGVPSAQVNMNNGQPLAALVAASFGVPVIALLSSPGATGGSYGAAQTLDEPTIHGFEAEQDAWKDFYAEIVSDLGAKGVVVEFPNIQNDPAYRQIASIGQGVELGVLHRDEGRAGFLNILDVPKLHDGLPPDPAEQAAKLQMKVDKANQVMSGQGQAGAVPGGTNQGDTNHDADNE